jgi:hypothetical protein
MCLRASTFSYRYHHQPCRNTEGTAANGGKGCTPAYPMAAEAAILNGGPAEWQKFMDANVANSTNIWGGSQQAQVNYTYEALSLSLSLYLSVLCVCACVRVCVCVWGGGSLSLSLVLALSLSLSLPPPAALFMQTGVPLCSYCMLSRMPSNHVINLTTPPRAPCAICHHRDSSDPSLIRTQIRSAQ